MKSHRRLVSSLRVRITLSAVYKRTDSFFEHGTRKVQRRPIDNYESKGKLSSTLRNSEWVFKVANGCQYH
jgi:hypothetical protein